MKIEKCYKPLIWFVKNSNCIELSVSSHHNQDMIKHINRYLKECYRYKSTKQLVQRVEDDKLLFDQIVKETLFIDEAIDKTNKSPRKSLTYIRLYCICNNIYEVPKCKVCGQTLQKFPFAFVDGIHREHCSIRCALKTYAAMHTNQLVQEQISEFQYNSKQIENYTNHLKEMICRYPNSFFSLINTKYKKNEFNDLKTFIYAQTQFIDFKCSFGTRCKYVLDGKHELYRCCICGKPIRKNFYVTNHQTNFWCSSKCLANDNVVNEYIGKKNSIAHINRKAIDYNTPPPECKVTYRSTLIVYDDEMNDRIYQLFLQHQKTLKFWLMKDKELYNYFMDATYPINYTNLHFGTRLYWLMHKFQEFPRCQTCGRQLDFKNVKLSDEWPTTCCPKCRVDYTAKLTEMRHRNHFYDLMLQQTEILPLYPREFYLDVGPDYKNFNVQCKLCGYKFSGPINKNYFYRYKNSNMFRCPYCHPSVKYRSKAEKSIFKFVFEELEYSDALFSYHNVIRPYELDIYVPSKKVAIEFNGIRWHSIENETTMDYHLYKTQRCEDVGVKLIHIWEDEWKNDESSIKQFIQDMLNGTQQIVVNEIDGKLLVDRSQFNKVSIDEAHLKIINTTPPQIVKRFDKRLNGNYMCYSVPDCGYFVVQSK